MIEVSLNELELQHVGLNQHEWDIQCLDVYKQTWLSNINN